jgi:transglutaminase/protease-like cytokinesis protein 3
MNEASKMRKLLLASCQPQPLRDVARVNGYGGRVTCGVSISSVKRRHKTCCEGQARLFKTMIRL